MNCEKITYYIEKGHLTKLNMSEKLQIRLHTLICNCCKNYQPDSDVVNSVLSLLKEDNNAETKSLSSEEKDELKQALERLTK